ncbi:MAG: hypothetical protein N0A00_02295 [Candidatus Bathyarchaeota archaeon]|nr:hypothetical protein [Candidatus Bathyarchaeota archaeon]
MKFKPSRDLPLFAVEFKTLSPLELSRIVKKMRDERVSAKSIEAWFRGRLDVYEELRKIIA